MYIKYVSALFFITGAFVFCLRNDWIILNFPKKEYKDIVQPAASRRECKIYYYKDGKFSFDKRAIVWKKSLSSDLTQIVNAWLDTIYEEQVANFRSSLGNILQSNNQIYISFENKIIGNDWSINKKWTLIESLLKTIQDASCKDSSLQGEPLQDESLQDASLQEIFFFVKNKPMDDEHLDFTVAWPIDGFIQ